MQQGWALPIAVPMGMGDPFQGMSPFGLCMSGGPGLRCILIEHPLGTRAPKYLQIGHEARKSDDLSFGVTYLGSWQQQ